MIKPRRSESSVSIESTPGSPGGVMESSMETDMGGSEVNQGATTSGLGGDPENESKLPDYSAAKTGRNSKNILRKINNNSIYI